MTRFLTFLAALLFVSAVQAQQYPTRTSDGVNDFANIIDPETESRIADKLAAMARDHDTEVAIATLSSLRFYAQDSTIEDYAKGLFNNWAIGDAEANNGILLIVFRDDRELRVEYGAGYNEDIQKQIDRVVDEDILPAFRTEDYANGLERGIDGLLVRVIDPPTENTAPASTETSDSDGGGNTLYYILGGVAAAIAGLIGLNRRNAAKFAKQPCSNCGKTGLQKSREVVVAATTETSGQGESRISCPSCGHVDVTPYTISKLRPDAPKGGGQSKGDGSTGKW